MTQQPADTYDEKYRRVNYFKYRPWLYRSFVKGLVRKAGIKSDGYLLDAGCGQGFFTNLFAECGINAVGVDVSRAGIAAATSTYRSSRVTFQVGDILDLKWTDQFDCVFTRSCSLYNTHDFAAKHDITNTLLSYVRPGGILIFDYYTKLNNRPAPPGQWIYHSLADVQEHFAQYAGARVYFSLRFDATVLKQYAFSSLASSVSSWIGLHMGIGGELVAFVTKQDS